MAEALWNRPQGHRSAAARNRSMQFRPELAGDEPAGGLRSAA